MKLSQQKSKHLKNLAKFSRFLRPYWSRGFYASIAVGLGVLLTLPLPLLSIYIIDYVIVQRDLRILNIICLLLIALLLIRILLNFLQEYCFRSFGRRVVFDLRLALFRHLQRLSLPFLQGNQPSYLAFRISDDVKQLDSLLAETYVSILTNILTFAFGAAIIFRMNWRLSLVSLAIMPLLWANNLILGKRLRILAKKLQEIRAVVISKVTESIAASFIIRAFRREKSELLKISRYRHKEINTEVKIGIVNTVNNSVRIFLNSLGSIIILWYGAREIMHGNLSLGQYIAFNAFLAYLYGPLRSLSSIYGNLQRALGALERVFSILDMPACVKDCNNSKDVKIINGSVEVNHLRFSYHDDCILLKDVSFSVKPGERIAVVGASGSGKTTLLNLICRFFDPWSGSIVIDGHDIKELTLKSLRDAISIVDQNAFLFEGSISDNIRFGRPKATYDEVVQAAKIANCHEFITRMPKGYETNVGQMARSLSNGERQRICLARAIIKDPRILILDEAMSAIDSESEYLIQTALDRAMKGRTTILVAHRLSTVMAADRVLVLHDGTIVEQGPPHDLIERDGYFSIIFDKQLKGRKESTVLDPVVSVEMMERVKAG